MLIASVPDLCILFTFNSFCPDVTLKICIHDISKTITARSFKLGEQIEDDEKINW